MSASNLAGTRAEFQDGGMPVAYPHYLVDGQGWVVAGTTATAIAAGTTTDTIIKGAPGRLCRILVTTAGTAALNVFDNASGHTGTIIGTVAASAVAGTLIEAQMPAANGITVQGAASTPAVTICFS